MLVLENSWAGITNAFLSSLADETSQKQGINYSTVGLGIIFTKARLLRIFWGNSYWFLFKKRKTEFLVQGKTARLCGY
jgi:hypothetical protein